MVNYKNSVRALVLSLIVLSCSSSRNVIDLGYEDYSKINPLLTIGAESTIRASETTLDVRDPSKAVFHVKEAITVHEKEGKVDGTVVLYYRDFVSVDYLKANLYDRNGELIRSYGLDDANDYSTSDGGTFFTDTRVKVLEPSYNTFPYTIEVEYQQTYTGLLNLPPWRPQTYRQSVEKASFTLIDQMNSGVRHLTKNMDKEPEISTDQLTSATTYKWDIEFKLPKDSEAYGPGAGEILPQVLVAPGRFKMENSSGNAESWEEFGKWYYELGKDTRELPEAAKAEIDKLVEGLEDEREIVSVLYDYLQDKTRYVSIQLGIGGWKPFPAEFVFENSYGDCKALTNYMQAALEHVGIKADAVLLRTGNNAPGLDEDFPSNQFNHVVIRVTLEDGEEIWLECTSKYLPADHLGAGDDGKKVLLVTENGGEVIQTPSKDERQNREHRISNFTIFEDGSTQVEARVYSHGALQDYALHAVMPVSEKERQDWINDKLPGDNVELTNYDLSGLDRIEDAFYEYEAKLNDFVRQSDKRIYVPINKSNQIRFYLPDEDKREYPVLFPYLFSESDSVYFDNPEGFEIEALPGNVEFSQDFGSYKAELKTDDDNNIYYKRYFALTQKEISPEDYPKLKEFFDEVRAADARQLVLVRKPS